MKNETSQHTPGPWKLIKEMDQLLITSESFGAVTSIPVQFNHVHIGEHEANAQLIAAAPELLEAVREAISTIEMLMDDKENASASMSLSSLYKAIKHATGK